MPAATLPAPDLTPSPFGAIPPSRTARWSVPYQYGSGVLVLTIHGKRETTETPYLVARVDDDETGAVLGWRLTNTLSGERYFVEADGAGRPGRCDCPSAYFRAGRAKCKHSLSLNAALPISKE